MKMNDFHMEEDYDFLKKYMGGENGFTEMPRGILTGNLNGQKKITEIQPTGSLRLQYVTDTSSAKKGFHIRFKHKCSSGHLPVGEYCYFIQDKDFSKHHDAAYSTKSSSSYAKR